MAEIRGRKIDLPGGRSVFVGHRVSSDFSTDESYYVQFTNGDTINRLRLSAEGMNALMLLLGGNQAGKSHIFDVEEKPGDSGHWRWQVVKDRDS